MQQNSITKKCVNTQKQGAISWRLEEILKIFAKDKEGKRVRKQLEVDFVVNQGNQRYYIQVAYDMTSEEKQTQEFYSLRNIPDSFKKIVIVNGTKKPWRNDEGFVIMGMKYFLLNAESLEF